MREHNLLKSQIKIDSFYTIYIVKKCCSEKIICLLSDLCPVMFSRPLFEK